MKVQVISIPVQDQEKALEFYTEKLLFVKKNDIPCGPESRWLTVVSSEQPDGPEILLEPSPNSFAPAKTYQTALLEAGIPYTQFNVENIEEEHSRLVALGVEFTVKPMEAGPCKIAVFNDTCGNLIQLVQMM